VPEEFGTAAMRHFRDGQLLYADRRISNADQLYGFAAECAIKSALVGLPACAPGGILANRYREHVDQLWDLVPLQAMQRRYGTLLAVLKGFRAPFADWSTDQRYGPDDAVTEAAATAHQSVARRVLGSVGLLGVRKEA